MNIANGINYKDNGVVDARGWRIRAGMICTLISKPLCTKAESMWRAYLSNHKDTMNDGKEDGGAAWDLA